ncbi:MAG: 6,7-dimethyl-8-ribityllumazine synthase [Deltaproteobacteria bacterium]|nr:6,7-dimethyl-8-ribityllumazine synthase [Deltaproteobacteria bacterium]MDZ4244129.1 6,7-dimethyl-8-ribityllumazine synthase [Candidatus Doudnabacteria bacterium]
MQNTNNGIFKDFDASGYRLGIVVAQFNKDITDGLLQTALAKASKYNIPEENVKIFMVAGSIEIPVILKAMAESKKYDCLVALGAVIRGETAHFEYVAKVVSEGILRVQLDSGIPVGFGILTCENVAQAKVRINFGANATEAALQSAKLIKGL